MYPGQSSVCSSKQKEREAEKGGHFLGTRKPVEYLRKIKDFKKKCAGDCLAS